MRGAGRPRRRTPDVVGKCPRTRVFWVFRENDRAAQEHRGIRRYCRRHGRDRPPCPRGRAGSWRLPRLSKRTARLERMAAAIRAQVSPILAANAEDVAEARAAGVDRSISRPARARSGARGSHCRGHRCGTGAQGSCWYRYGILDPSERHADRARPGTSRRHWHHLRKPAERHRRRRRALPESRQRGDPARRLR